MAGLVVANEFYKQMKRFKHADQEKISLVILKLHMDPTSPAHVLHRVDGNAGWWSAYVDGDIRIILQREEGTLVLCHVDHHDDAYRWARRHKMLPHPKTGTMQLVELQTSVVVESKTKTSGSQPETPCAKRLGLSREDLLAFGIPEEWVDRVLSETSVDALLEIGEYHLPPEAAEAVLQIAVGERPEKDATDNIPPDVNTVPDENQITPFTTEDGKRSWHVITSDDDLKLALKEAWGVWAVYLHPKQRAVANRFYSRPARVSGSAGTGKTVVALHHAKYIVENDASSRVLLTTFSENLANDLVYRIGALLKPRVLERVEVRTFRDFGYEEFRRLFGKKAYIPTAEELREEVMSVIEERRTALPKGLSPNFVLSEWEHIVEARNVLTWEAYRSTVRRGALYRLAEQKRAQLWEVFEAVRKRLHEKGWMSEGEMFGALAEHFSGPTTTRAYTHVVVDEAQDISACELAFLAAYAKSGGGLFFAGDLGQRIARYPFSWMKYGIDLRGRSKVLKVNYRTSQEIRSMADRLLEADSTDADGIVQKRRGTISLLSGPKPQLTGFDTIEKEIEGVAHWIDELIEREGLKREELAVFYRSENERSRALQAIARSRFAKKEGIVSSIRMGTMLGSKGLEYRAVVVLGCDSDVIPSPERLAEGNVIATIDDIYETERNLLYVACTRARDFLLVTWTGTASEFLLDLTER